VGGGGVGGSAALIPAATSTVVGLSMYFSIRRSLFQDMYRSSKLAVLTYNVSSYDVAQYDT
jgi:hypothetical protein